MPAMKSKKIDTAQSGFDPANTSNSMQFYISGAAANL